MVLRTCSKQDDSWPGQCLDLYIDEGGLSRGLSERTSIHLPLRRIQLRNFTMSFERLRSKNDRPVCAICRRPGCGLFRKSMLERYDTTDTRISKCIVWTDEKSYSRYGNFQAKKRASRRGTFRCHESEWPMIRSRNTRDCIITRTKSCRFRVNPRVGWLAKLRTSSSVDLSSIAVLLRDRHTIVSYSIWITGLFLTGLPRTSMRNDLWSITEKGLELISRIIAKVREKFQISVIFLPSYDRAHRSIYLNWSTEGTGPLADPPVVFETTEDPTINNLTRNDINCDKTGTCYDGMYILNRH